MTQRRPIRPVAVLALLLLVLASGCLADRQRAGLTVSWEPAVRLHDAPVDLVDGWPAMLAVGAPVSVSGSVAVEVTGVGATVTINDTDRVLAPIRLVINDEGVNPGDAEAPTQELRDGDTLLLTFAPPRSNPERLPPNASVEVHVEVRWRYAGDASFDAGRLTFDQNVTVRPTPGLGTGAAEVADGRIERVVFPAINRTGPTGEFEVRVFQVTSDGPTELSPISLELTAGEGVLLGDPTPRMRLPDGTGYLVLVTEAPIESVTVVPLERSEERTPFPGFALVALALAARFARPARSR